MNDKLGLEFSPRYDELLCQVPSETGKCINKREAVLVWEVNTASKSDHRKNEEDDIEY